MVSPLHRRAVQDVANAHSQSDEDCGQYSHNRGLQQRAEVYNGAMFSAFWTDAVNINDRAELVRHLEAAGLEGSAILKKAEETEYAKRLEARLNSLPSVVLFGSPTFIVGDDVFFGND